MNKNQIAYRIKHSPLLKNSYIIAGSAALKLAGLFVKQDKNLVLFVSNIGKSYSGSPLMIYKYMQEHPEYSDYECIWAFNNPEQFKQLKTVKFDSPEYFLTALKAKYWITDVNIERSLKFKNKKTKYLNTWHGVALKKIGNDDANSGRYDYSNIDYLCVSCEHDTRVYTSALNARADSFLKCGMPRNDPLFEANDEVRAAIRKKLDIPEGKKVILFAPTWRDSVNFGKSFDIKIPADFKKWEAELKDDYILFFRAHDRTTKVMDIQFNDFIRNYSNYEPLNDLLIASDVLITDYSSIIFDYSILEKPAICFGYDYDEYVKERGVYFDAREVFPGGVISNETDVLSILKDTEKLDSYSTAGLKKVYMEYSNGNAAEICVRKLFGDHS